jgi:acyl-coenzyme A synthetase/AMP-(fatty) acid ligase
MVPAEVEVLTELPKTSTGKTKKVELRDMARNSNKKERA